MKRLDYGKAICYSGYRKGHSPIDRIYPTNQEVKEDLLILEKDFDYIRMYDSGPHAKQVCEVITKENIDLKVLLGMDLLGEISNPDCSWGGEYTVEEIAENIKYNQKQLYDLINLENQYRAIVCAVSAGNESVPEWNENLLSPGRILYFVRELKKHTNSLVTYCDNNFYWKDKLKEVANEVDFISVHIYPVWLGKKIEEAIPMCIQDFEDIENLYPDKQCIITETGWPTISNGRGIPSENANELSQLFYNKEIARWSKEREITVFFFEAFDEFWKGSEALDEPEKHWGYYYDDRTPKLIKQNKKDA